MKISNNKVVSIAYELSISDENQENELVEVVDKDQPMEYLHGMSGLPEAFEKKMEGLSVGSKFKFEIDAENGYGEMDEEAIVPLPISTFFIDGKLDDEMMQIGNYIPMTDDEGEQLRGKILSIDKEQVIIDFNHPLVGKIMNFVGEVLAIREATISEIEHGHVHEDGQEHN